MADEVTVSLRLPKALHARIKELAPARGASAWMVRALEYVAGHPDAMKPIVDATSPSTGRRPLERQEVTTYWKHRTK